MLGKADIISIRFIFSVLSIRNHIQEILKCISQIFLNSSNQVNIICVPHVSIPRNRRWILFEVSQRTPTRNEAFVSFPQLSAIGWTYGNDVSTRCLVRHRISTEPLISSSYYPKELLISTFIYFEYIWKSHSATFKDSEVLIELDIIITAASHPVFFYIYFLSSLHFPVIVIHVH